MSLRLSFLASTVERIMTGCHVRRYVVLAVVSSVRKGAHNPMLPQNGHVQWNTVGRIDWYTGIRRQVWPLESWTVLVPRHRAIFSHFTALFFCFFVFCCNFFRVSDERASRVHCSLLDDSDELAACQQNLLRSSR